jgi:hypothetical protein
MDATSTANIKECFAVNVAEEFGELFGGIRDALLRYNHKE